MYFEPVNNNQGPMQTQSTTLRGFVTFKLVVSSLYLLPAGFLAFLSIVVNFVFMLFSTADSENSTYVFPAFLIILFLIVIPSILAIILFVMNVISAIKFSKNKYNRTLDLIITTLFILLHIFIIILTFYMSVYILNIIFVPLLIALIVNWFYIIENKI